MSKLIKSNEENAFFDNVARLIEQARRFVGRTADLTMCMTYFEVGRMIVEEEQGGAARAAYGTKLLAVLSEYLNKRFGRGFSTTNLKNARSFYQIYAPSIRQTASDKLGNSDKIENRLIDILATKGNSQIQQAMPTELYPFKVSWSHYLILMRIKNEQERRFYEIEAANSSGRISSCSGNTAAVCTNVSRCLGTRTK